MTNKEFKALTKEQKRLKFKAVLKSKTKGCLTDEEINKIMLAVPARNQCKVFVCFDVAEFSRLLSVKKPNTGRTVFGKPTVCVDRAAAILLRTAGGKALRELHVYIPPQLYRKDS